MTQTINLAASTTALSSSANPQTAGQPVSFTATLTPIWATGTVTFYADGKQIGNPVTLFNGTASITTTWPAAGTYTITATYGGNPTFAASTGSLTQSVEP